MTEMSVVDTVEKGEADERVATLDVAADTSWFAKRYPHQDAQQLAGYYRNHRPVLTESDMPREEAYAHYRQRLSHLRISQVPPRPGDEVFDLLPERRQHKRRWDEQQALLSGERSPEKNTGWGGSASLFAGFLVLIGGVVLGVMGWSKLQSQALSVENNRPYLNRYVPSSAQAGMVIIRNQPPSPDRAIDGAIDRAIKTVATAGLRVEDAAGALNQPIALKLGIDPASFEQKVALRISGLPQSAVLSQGERLTTHDWVLNDGDESNLTLTMTETSEPELVLTVSAYETVQGTLAAPPQQLIVSLEGEDNLVVPLTEERKVSSAPAVDKTIVVGYDLNASNTSSPVAEGLSQTARIVPANGPPENVIQDAIDTPKVENSPTANLVVKGDALYQAGELTAARQFYLRAYDQGAPDVAFKIAQTYDPAIHTKLQVKGLESDGALAQAWYQKAKNSEGTLNRNTSVP